uniref:DNA mismatch repair proteins mutS family domain-containing protein n=1 Tax=viral metagenome TaxID=1070528 RepID=A0A6C0CV74_9ZZZZ
MIKRFFVTDTFQPSNQDIIHSCDKTYQLKPLEKTVEVGNDLFNDLEVFHPYDNESMDATLSHIFSATKTLGGQNYIEDLLKTPQHDLKILNDRKHCLASIHSINNEVDYRSLEQDFLWIYSDKDDTINDLLNGIYFNNFILKRLNESESILTSYNIYKICISPTIGILSPFLYFILPYAVLKYKFGSTFNLSFKTYIKLLWKSFYSSSSIYSLFGSNGKMLSRIQSFTYLLSFCFYFQGIINSTQIAMTTNKIIKYICDKMNNAIIFLQQALTVIERNKEILHSYQTSLVSEPFQEMNASLLTFLSNYTPYTKFTIFSHFGKLLKFYKTIKPTLFLPIINRFYLIDALDTINAVKSKLGLCYPTYIAYEGSPLLVMNDAWNIHIDSSKAIKNTFVGKNTIITGPNAGGKSTFIKMMCTNALLSQTLCVSASSSIQITPFHLISSQINIPDCKGHESLFEAEMNRCLYNLRAIEQYAHAPCFVVMDEIFNSTNVVEAISGAYAILENISKNKNTICMITTHLNYLTNLRKTSSFECYCMSVKIDKNDENQVVNDECISIQYPYVIKKGVSKQYIALELLRDKGFDPTIIKKALEIKSKFV